MALFAIGAAGCGSSSASSERRPAADAVDLLPDLDQEPPGALTGKTRTTRDGRRFRLGFASSVANEGKGPLIVRGRRASTREPVMRAVQEIRRSDGSRRRAGVAGTIRYVHSETHQHWHLVPFDQYELRRASDYVSVRPDRKTGFCLGDRYDRNEGVRLPNEPPTKVWRTRCGQRRKDLLTIVEGISVGYADNYQPQLEGQFFDVTGLAAGRYVLVHHVNPDRRLLESDYDNNAASLLFELRWPRGFAASPSIRVIERCAETPRCGS